MKPLAPVTPQLARTDQVGRLNSPANAAEKEKAKLKRATQEFESFFNYYMLKTMRETIPKDGLSKGAPFAGSGKDTFDSMFDMELSKLMAGKNSRSIAQTLYNSLEKLIDARVGEEKKTESAPIPLEKARQPVQPTNLRPRRQPIDLPARKPTELIHGRGSASKPRSATNQSSSPADKVFSRFRAEIEAAAAEHKVDTTLLASVIAAESSGNPDAVSKAGAKGLMQLIDSTAESLGVTDVFDPGENINAGAKFLADLIDRFQDVKLALAAYNAGPGNMAKYDGIPPFRETRAYVDKVTRLAEQASIDKEL